MKLQQLLTEMANAPEAKIKKVKSFLTPELAQQHFDVLCNTLALFVPTKDLDVLQSKILGDTVDANDIKFYLKLFVKSLPGTGAALRGDAADGSLGEIYGKLPPIKDKDGRDEWTCGFWIFYDKAKWSVTHDKVGWRFGRTTKRFDSPNDVVPYLKKVFKAFEKLRAEWTKGQENEGK